MICPTCCPDGLPDTDYLDSAGSCLFGCNANVDTDSGICPRCHTHATNEAQCGACGTRWQQTYDHPSPVWERTHG